MTDSHKAQPKVPLGENPQSSPPSGVVHAADRTDTNDSQDSPLDVRINVQDIATPSTKPTLPEIRESTAGDLAKLIIYMFGWALAGAFIIAVLLIVLTIKLPEEMITKVLPNIGSILEIIKIVGALFTSLLAFILGYYFSQVTKSDK